MPMTQSVAQLKQYRFWFGWGFVVSFAVLSFWALAELVGSPSPGKVGIGLSPITAMIRVEYPGLELVVAVASLLASVTSLVGFVLTIVATRRKERREQRSIELQLEKANLENKKLRREIEQNEAISKGAGSPNNLT